MKRETVFGCEAMLAHRLFIGEKGGISLRQRTTCVRQVTALGGTRHEQLVQEAMKSASGEKSAGR